MTCRETSTLRARGKGTESLQACFYSDNDFSASRDSYFIRCSPIIRELHSIRLKTGVLLRKRRARDRKARCRYTDGRITIYFVHHLKKSVRRPIARKLLECNTVAPFLKDKTRIARFIIYLCFHRRYK